jgi:hypothetical protein
MAGGNAFEQSASGMSQAGSLTQQAANPMASFSQFQNPYTDQVVNNSLNDLERARQMQMNQIGASAQAAGAFGGSRHGLVESETNRNFADRAGNMAGNLRMQGFDNAVNNAFRNSGSQLGAAQMLGGLAGQGFDMADTINQRQMQHGLFTQGMNQQIIDAARNRFNQFTAAPGESLQYPLAAIGGVPHPSTQTTEQSPGLFNYLSLGLGLL